MLSNQNHQTPDITDFLLNRPSLEENIRILACSVRQVASFKLVFLESTFRISVFGGIIRISVFVNIIWLDLLGSDIRICVVASIIRCIVFGIQQAHYEIPFLLSHLGHTQSRLFHNLHTF